jgi:Na+-driven multidrug efflux pump
MTTYASACGKNQYSMYSTISGTLFHLALMCLIFDNFENKMTGTAICSAIQFMTRSAVGFTLTWFDKDINGAFISFRDPESWKDLKEMYAYGYNTVLLRVMAWWAFDIFTQLAATLPKNYLSGQTILRNIGLFTFMLPAGLSGASTVLVGKQIGKNRIDMATRMYYIIKTVTYTLSSAQVVAVWFFEKQIIGFYTKDKEIYDAIQPAWWVIVIFVFFDSV